MKERILIVYGKSYLLVMMGSLVRIPWSCLGAEDGFLEEPKPEQR